MLSMMMSMALDYTLQIDLPRDWANLVPVPGHVEGGGRPILSCERCFYLISGFFLYLFFKLCLRLLLGAAALGFACLLFALVGGFGFLHVCPGWRVWRFGQPFIYFIKFRHERTAVNYTQLPSPLSSLACLKLIISVCSFSCTVPEILLIAKLPHVPAEGEWR